MFKFFLRLFIFKFEQFTNLARTNSSQAANFKIFCNLLGKLGEKFFGAFTQYCSKNLVGLTKQVFVIFF